MAQRKPLKTQLEGYYTVKEGAEYLGVRPRSVWRWAENGTLRAVLVDGRYFIPAEVMHQFIKPLWGNYLFGEMAKDQARPRRELKARLSRLERIRQARNLHW